MTTAGLNLPVILTPGGDYDFTTKPGKLRTPSPRPELPDIYNNSGKNNNNNSRSQSNGFERVNSERKSSDSFVVKNGNSTTATTARFVLFMAVK